MISKYTGQANDSMFPVVRIECHNESVPKE